MMRPSRLTSRWLYAVLVVAAGVASPVGASTLVHEDLDDLVAGNGTVLVGEVIDASSYWNAEGSFILTDVRILPQQVLKGRRPDRREGEDLTVTLMGGTVGDLTTLVIGGAELLPGRSYVLFLNEEDLPGAPHALTVRDHVQGVFDLLPRGEELRAISQANSHPLLPDAFGRSEPPGGAQGMPFTTLVRSIRESAAAARERR